MSNYTINRWADRVNIIRNADGHKITLTPEEAQEIGKALAGDSGQPPADVKPPKPMTVRILRDHLNRLIDLDPSVTDKPVMLMDTWQEIVNSSIVDGFAAVETFRTLKIEIDNHESEG